MYKYPRFRDALLELAPTNRQRAALLGVSLRTLAYYLSGTMLPPVELVKQFPTLDHALTLDLPPRPTKKNNELAQLAV